MTGRKRDLMLRGLTSFNDWQHRTLLLTVLLGSLAVAAVAGWAIAAAAPRYHAVDFGWLLLAGLLLAYVLGRPRRSSDECPVISKTTNPPGILQKVLAGTLISVGLAAGLVAVLMLWSDQSAWQRPFLLWLSALASLLLGAGRFDDRLRLSVRVDQRPGQAFLVGTLMILTLAVGLRVYRLDQVPPGIFIDETNSALDAIAIVQGSPASPFGTSWYETPTGYIYLQAAFIKLFGNSFLALKLPGLLAGALTVLGTICLGRLLFGESAGLLAGFLVAVAQWPLNLSRWGWNETFPPAAHLWATFLLLRGLHQRRSVEVALAGLILGLGMYTYLAIRLVVLAVAGYLVVRLALERNFLRAHFGRLLLFGCLWAVTFAPLAVTYFKNPFLFTNRSSEITIQRDIDAAGGKLDPLLENVRRHLLMFNVEGDHNPRLNVPARPMLDPIMGTLLVLAFVRALMSLPDQRVVLLLTWMVAAMLGGILSNLSESPQAYRTFDVLPVLCLLIGELLARLRLRLVQLLRAVATPRAVAQVASGVALAVALGLSTALNLQGFFGVFATDPRVYIGFTPLETAIARELVSVPDPTSYFLSSKLYHFSVPRYFMADLSRPPGAPPTYQLFSGLEDLPLASSAERDVTLLWEREWIGLAAVVRNFYPAATVEQVPDRGGDILYQRLRVPASAGAQRQGLMVRAVSADSGPPRRVAEPTLRPADLRGPLEWSGGLFVQRSGTWALSSADGANVELDGQRVSGSRYLYRGLHTLRVVERETQAAAGLRLFWSEAGSSALVAVPSDALVTLTPELGRGLLGRYFRGERWEGQPLFSRVDPLILFAWREQEPISGPFSVSWLGELTVPRDGSYGFQVDSDDGAQLWIDDRHVGAGLTPDKANFFEARVQLAAGRKRIRLDYFQRGGAKSVQLRWSPPNGPSGVIPSEVLTPAPNALGGVPPS
jgi:4-amino-4-deoxy-L-arabinose transferase-like glycosyltransferase